LFLLVGIDERQTLGEVELLKLEKPITHFSNNGNYPQGFTGPIPPHETLQFFSIDSYLLRYKNLSKKLPAHFTEASFKLAAR
jgi:hypothetical protein